MDRRAADGAANALVLMLEAQIPGAEIAAYVTAQGSMRRLGERSGPPQAWRVMGEDLCAALGCARCVCVDGGAFERASQFCALQPVRGADGAAVGFLLVIDPRRKRLGPSLTRTLAVAAEVAVHILGDVGPRPTPVERRMASGAAPPVRGAILPRVAAYRLIDALRVGADATRALMLIDLDRFHAINAALGDVAGDALLAAVRARLETQMQPGDHLARLEGDRFLVLAARSRRAAAAFANDLLAVTREPIPVAERNVIVQASIGIVADLPQDAPTEVIMLQAQEALRTAKAEGRNRYVLHKARANADEADASHLELDLAEAPGRGQMHLVYQPYIDLRTGGLAGVEALMRWRHPKRGELAPSAFIPLAEATGLILPLGAWALRTALAAARTWPEAMTVSVNVSALQFHQPGFVREVIGALEASGVAPGRLELEITETVLMRDNSETTSQLRALIAHGVRIALDDFGTGYSALAYLGRLPHHRIKLDRSFIHDLGCPATLELVRAILALAQRTGVAVTAEGVERPDQLALVRKLGFTHAQGFLTGMPASDPVGIIQRQPLPAL